MHGSHQNNKHITSVYVCVASYACIEAARGGKHRVRCDCFPQRLTAN